MKRLLLAIAMVLVGSAAHAEAPVASYIFPAGGQRGKTVDLRVGGLFLGKSCGMQMTGPGVAAAQTLKSIPTRWFEGPVLPLPDSQRQEDYPKDLAGTVKIAADAPLGFRAWQLSTSQGVTPSMRFVIGDLPEIVEDEIPGTPIPVVVTMPVTINGRIFPREDVDLYNVTAKKGKAITFDVIAQRLGSPLEARLEILDAKGRRLQESDLGSDPRLRFVPPADGVYQVKIHDISFLGSQSHVYRLTITDGPLVDRVFPLGGKRGDTVAFDLFGQHLAERAREVKLPDATGLHQDTFGGALPVQVDVDELPEVREGQSLVIPSIANGQIAKLGEVDSWKVKLTKGDSLECELRAGRLGSPLDGVLSVVGAEGKEIARADQPAAGQLDPVLRFTAPADGEFTIQVADRFTSRGGPDFAYRLRVTSSSTGPDFKLTLANDAFSIARGGQVKIPIQVERIGGMNEPIALTLEGLPEGITLASNTIAAKQQKLDLTLKASDAVSIGPVRLKIVGTAKMKDRELTRTAQITGSFGGDSPLLGVGLATPFTIKGEYDMRWAARGGVYSRRYTIERTGYDGPIVVSLTDKQARHLQGVTAAPITVPAGATEFEYSVQLPPWMEMGRTSRVCVMGTAFIKDEAGKEHEVTYSSVNPNEQMVAVIEPGKLGLTVDRPSVLMKAGQKAEVSFQVLRGPKLEGAVKVELIVPEHLKDVNASPIKVAANQTDGTMAITFGTAPGPVTMPLVLRATLMHQGQPIVAETKMELAQ